MGIDAQGYSGDKVAFTNFLVRMYNNAPFEGVRAVNDYDNAYLISVLALDPAKYKNNESVINRVSSVKAMAGFTFSEWFQHYARHDNPYYGKE